MSSKKKHIDYTKSIFALGDTTVFTSLNGLLMIMCSENFWFFEGQRFLSIQDRFEDPLDLKEATMGLWPWGTELPGGKPYDIVAYWEFEKYFLMDKIQ